MIRKLLWVTTVFFLLAACGEPPAPSPHSLAERHPVIIATETDITPPDPPPPPAFLLLNEVYYDAPGRDTEGELFIELHGEPGGNLSRHQILFINGDDGKTTESLMIPEGTRVDGNGFFVMADSPTGQPGTTRAAHADWIRDFDPPNGPDCVQLLDDEGSLLDALGYGHPLPQKAQNGLSCYEGNPAPDVFPGESLTRISAGQDSGDNAADWGENPQPSPGN